ncbi:ABC transporter permease subunit [candidate division KSB1 bacterium]|nr:ABC transporter permease subunit [candidate division KSB1 bacterium]
MLNRNYIQKILIEHRTMLFYSISLIGLMQFLIVMMVTTIDVTKLAQSFMNQLPPQFQGIFGEEFLQQLSIRGAIAFGYNHPLVVAFLVIMAIMLPARHISGEIESGALELLLALPVKRRTIFWSLWFSSAFLLLLLVISGWVGSFIGVLVFPKLDHLPIISLLKIGLNVWLLMLVINAYTFLLAAYARENEKVALRATGLTLFFYFLNLAIKIWPKINFLKPFTIFNYYQPQSLMMDSGDFVKNSLILLILTIVLLLVAFRKMNERDLPG